MPVDELALASVLGAYPEIAAAYLFGSYARGDERSDSDLDIGLVLKRRSDTALDHHRWLRALAARLEQASGGLRLDLVVLDAQGPIFRHAVLREGRRIYEADAARRIDFESDTCIEYLDFRPTWELAAGQALRGFRSWLESRR